MPRTKPTFEPAFIATREFGETGLCRPEGGRFHFRAGLMIPRFSAIHGRLSIPSHSSSVQKPLNHLACDRGIRGIC